MRDDFERVLCGPDACGLFESNYLKANDPGGGGALWLKYNLLAPTHGRRPRFGELWAVSWKGPGQRPIVVKKNVSGRDIRTDPRTVALDIGGASLRANRATGAIEDGDHRIAWDLELLEGDTPLFMYPFPLLYEIGFPKKKILTPRPKQIFRGHVEVDDESVPVEGWVGIRGHNWGPEHAHSYAYGNANLWEQPGSWAFDAASARLVVGPTVSPLLSVSVLRLPKTEIPFADPWRWINSTAQVDFPTWSCTFRHGDSTLRSRWTLDPEDVAGLRYLHPDGHVSYCYNTKYAELDLDLERREGRERRSSKLAELEFLTNSPIPGIPLHGNDLLPEI